MKVLFLFIILLTTRYTIMMSQSHSIKKSKIFYRYIYGARSKKNSVNITSIYDKYDDFIRHRTLFQNKIEDIDELRKIDTSTLSIGVKYELSDSSIITLQNLLNKEFSFVAMCNIKIGRGTIYDNSSIMFTTSELGYIGSVINVIKVENDYKCRIGDKLYNVIKIYSSDSSSRKERIDGDSLYNESIIYIDRKNKVVIKTDINIYYYDDTSKGRDKLFWWYTRELEHILPINYDWLRKNKIKRGFY